jgi:predicted GNAT family acetyltransferase
VSGTELRVADAPIQLRYKGWHGDSLAGYIRYTVYDGVVTLVYTDVDPVFEGQGVGVDLVEGTLRDLRERGLRAEPVCPFVAAYMRRHPEWDDLRASRR